jgi:hypothetical protein
MRKSIYLILLVFVSFVSCKKKEDPSPGNQTNNTNNNTNTSADQNPTSTATYYLVFFDGTSAVKLEQSVSGVYNGSVSGGGTDYVTTGGGFYGLDENYDPIFKGGISFGKNYGGFPDHDEAYNSYSTGGNSFGNESAQTTGFIIEYKDASGTYWTSDKGTADQTGSAITVNSKTAYNSLSLAYIIDGTFNCKIYDGNGNSRTLTNGKFKTMMAYD